MFDLTLHFSHEDDNRHPSTEQNRKFILTSTKYIVIDKQKTNTYLLQIFVAVINCHTF